MKTDFTPGPWTIGRVSGADQEVHIDALHPDNDIGCQTWKSLAVCYGEDERPVLGMQKALANARLIAAAPDLYSVLSELEESADYWSEYDVPLGIVDRIKAALSKARVDK